MTTDHQKLRVKIFIVQLFDGPEPELGVKFSLLGIPAVCCSPRIWVGKESIRRNIFDFLLGL